MLRRLLSALRRSPRGDGPEATDRAADGRTDGSRAGESEGEPAVDDGSSVEVAAEESDDGGNDASSEDAADGGRSLWDLIPRWQYDGHYVQSGGATRDEQERAIEGIQAQADAIEAEEDVDDRFEGEP